jgi:hypothetical protein
MSANNLTAVRGWINNIGHYKVEHTEIARPGGKPYYSMAQTGVGVIHTTEGNTVAGALSSLMKDHFAPTFIVGEDRILQCRPLGTQGAALHDPANRFAYIQIEMVGRSQQVLWQPVLSSMAPLAAIIGWAAVNCSMQIQRPTALWKDDCSDLRGTIWASNNRRRQAEIFPHTPGWYGHLECTNQGPSWHWDPGALDYSAVFALARTWSTTLTKVQKSDEDNTHA